MKQYVTLGIRNMTLLDGFGLLDSYRHDIAGTQCKILMVLYVGEGFPSRCCYEVKDRKRLRMLMEQEVRAGKYTADFFKTIDRSYKEALADIKEMADADIAKLGGQTLVRYFDILYRIYIATIHPMVLAIYASDLHDLLDKELRKAIGGESPSPEKINECTALLLTPTRLSTVQKEEQILFGIQSVFESRYKMKTRTNYDKFCTKPDVTRRLEKLTREFGWFHMEYVGEAWTSDDYREHLWRSIKDLAEAKEEWEDQKSPQQRLAETVEAQQVFFRQHPHSEFLQQLVFAMQEFLVVLDFSKADLVEGLYNGRPLLDEIGKRLGLNSWIDVRYLLPKEIREYLKEGRRVTPEYIKERRRNWAGWLRNDSISVYFGDEARGIADRLMEKDIVKDVKQFNGLTAYPGKVRGVASVITSASDRDKFKKGQILVTHDTTAELTSVIRMSSAIVADQGSLLSHTAIVAREFKIPCLVLTKVGTKVVKDGDKIEVDADNGVVRKLG